MDSWLTAGKMEMAEKPNREKILLRIGDLQLNLINMEIWFSVPSAVENDKWWVWNGWGGTITERHFQLVWNLKESQSSHYFIEETRHSTPEFLLDLSPADTECLTGA